MGHQPRHDDLYRRADEGNHERPLRQRHLLGRRPYVSGKGFAELARAIREQSSKSIWCFTGYLFENLVKNPEQLELLRQIDVLVDGPFVQALRDEDLFFRGSSNQRIINVQKSLKEGRVIELNLTTENPNPVL